MIEIIAEVKKWGNSLAVVLPKENFKEVRPGKRIVLLIPEGSVDLRKEFGSLKNVLKKPTEELMRIADEGWK